jgi:cation-transporting P-type ATPase E
MLAQPYTWWRLALVGAMLAAFGLVAAVPITARFFALSFTDHTDVTLAVAMAVIGGIGMTWIRRLGRRRSATPRV